MLPVLALLGLIAWRSPAPGREARGRWLLAMAPVTIGLVLLDALVAEPLGIAWLPADRLVDGLHWALVLGGALGVAALAARLARPRVVVPLALAACLPLAWGPYEPGLSLWPWAGQWPKEPEVTRGLRLDALWPALRAAPPGRILFVRSGVSLDWRPEWWRPHTHVTALTPIRAGRAIIGGTFTHPSPVAGLLYTGSAANRPLTLLAEQRDGRTLFGVPLAALDAETFDRRAARLGISTVVAVDEDAGVAPFLEANPELRRCLSHRFLQRLRLPRRPRRAHLDRPAALARAGAAGRVRLDRAGDRLLPALGGPGRRRAHPRAPRRAGPARGDAARPGPPRWSSSIARARRNGRAWR